MSALPAARQGDLVQGDVPHCHSPIHPPAPIPTAVPLPPVPVPITGGLATVLIGGQPAARVGDATSACIVAGCTPGGTGLIAKGSATVMIGGSPAARVGDVTSHPGCAAPIPSPTGKILPPGCPTVMIG